MQELHDKLYRGEIALGDARLTLWQPAVPHGAQ